METNHLGVKNQSFLLAVCLQKLSRKGQVRGFKAWVRIPLSLWLPKPEAPLGGRCTSFSLCALQLPNTLPIYHKPPPSFHNISGYAFYKPGPICHNVNSSSMQTSPDCYPTGIIAPSSLLPSQNEP